MLSNLLAILIVCINRTLALNIKAGVINGQNVGNPVIESDGQTIYLPDGEYPYMASVEFMKSHICGGVIVHESVVITAAHCVNDFDHEFIGIRAGTMYRGGTREPRQVSKISHKWFHPYFQDKYFENDVALLFLETPLVFNEYVNKINIEYVPDYTGETLTALGWGWTEAGRYSINLKKADLTVITSKICKEKTKAYRVTKDMICAVDKNETQGLCDGDSGGPFVKHFSGHPERDVLAGIISWNVGGCDANNKKIFGFTSLYYVQSLLRDEFYNNNILIYTQKKNI